MHNSSTGTAWLPVILAASCLGDRVTNMGPGFNMLQPIQPIQMWAISWQSGIQWYFAKARFKKFGQKSTRSQDSNLDDHRKAVAKIVYMWCMDSLHLE